MHLWYPVRKVPNNQIAGLLNQARQFLPIVVRAVRFPVLSRHRSKMSGPSRSPVGRFVRLISFRRHVSSVAQSGVEDCSQYDCGDQACRLHSFLQIFSYLCRLSVRLQAKMNKAGITPRPCYRASFNVCACCDPEWRATMGLSPSPSVQQPVRPRCR